MHLLKPSNKQLIVFLLLLISLSMSLLVLAKQPSSSSTAQYAVFSRDGSQLIFVNAAGDEIIKQHARTGKIIKRVPFKLAAGSTLLAPTPDGFKLLAVHAKGIDVIHNGMGKVLRTLPHPSGRYDWQGQAIKQNVDGSLLAIPSLKNNSPKIYLIHTGSGKIIRTLKLSQQGRRWNPNNSIGSFGFSADKRWLAYTVYAQGDSTLYLYDINQQKIQMHIDKLGGGNYRDEMIYFNRKNTMLLLSGVRQKQIKLIDIKQQGVKKLPYPQTSFANFTVDDNSLLIIQAHKNLLTFRHLTTGKQQHKKLASHSKAYAPVVIQSANKALLVLPRRPLSGKETQTFLLINGKSGNVLH